jgi:hypothetical protein
LDEGVSRRECPNKNLGHCCPDPGVTESFAKSKISYFSKKKKVKCAQELSKSL